MTTVKLNIEFKMNGIYSFTISKRKNTLDQYMEHFSLCMFYFLPVRLVSFLETMQEKIRLTIAIKLNSTNSAISYIRTLLKKKCLNRFICFGTNI